jgi:hypothetical protein
MSKGMKAIWVFLFCVAVFGCQPKTIAINIDKDFEYVSNGWPLGLSVGETPLSELSRVPPVNLLKEPQYKSKTPLYGSLTLGNTENNRFVFALDEVEPGKLVLYFDRNRNLDLTDDGHPLNNEGTGKFAAIIDVHVPIKLETGNEINRSYRIWFWINDINGKLYPKYYARCHYRKKIKIGDKEYTAIVFEFNNHHALYMDSGVWIDLNHDGKLSEGSEHFYDNSVIKIEGKEYKIKIDHPYKISSSPHISVNHIAPQKNSSPQSVNNNTSSQLDADRGFLARRFASVKGLAFDEIIAKPSWWNTVESPVLGSETEVDRLWQSKPRCCIESSQLDRNNREFFKSCYLTIESHPSDDRVTVKCLWLMDIAVSNKEIFNEYLLANYFDHNAGTHTCANCAPGDIVARVADDLSTQYERAGKTMAAIELLESVFDRREAEVSAWVQAELYTHLGKLYLKTELTRERKQRIEHANERLLLVKDHETMKQRYPDFERVYLQVKAQR